MANELFEALHTHDQDDATRVFSPLAQGGLLRCRSADSASEMHQAINSPTWRNDCIRRCSILKNLLLLQLTALQLAEAAH